jgi:hypothetical protein
VRSPLKFTVPTLLVTLLVAGCGSGAPASPPLRSQLSRYVTRIEPIRLAVNRLLEGADPILDGFRRHHLSDAEAAKRMGVLERRFAAYTVDVAAIAPANARLAALQSAYAQTYVLEDAYLSALVVGLAEHDLDALPDTQDAQRSAIIRWRTGLEVLARVSRFALPADLQQAGRGEIAPSPDGS